MTEPAETPPPTPQSQRLRELVQKTAVEVRERPVKSVVWAFFVGIFLTMVPVGRIVGAALSLALALIRPALMLLGVAKLLDEAKRREPPKP